MSCALRVASQPNSGCYMMQPAQGEDRTTVAKKARSEGLAGPPRAHSIIYGWDYTIILRVIVSFRV